MLKQLIDNDLTSVPVERTQHYLSLLEERRAELRSRLSCLGGADGFILEIGSGHGHFLTAYAAAHPKALCVGIDLIGERVDRACRKRDRARLPNLHFIQAEARLFLEVLPPTVALDGVFVLFPDPWPKLRHNKHRILQPLFLVSLAERCASGCPLYFRTDHTPYFAAVTRDLATVPAWTVVDEPWPFEHVTVFQQRTPAYHSLVARCRMPRPADKKIITAINVG